MHTGTKPKGPLSPLSPYFRLGTILHTIGCYSLYRKEKILKELSQAPVCAGCERIQGEKGQKT